jgi:exosortase B
VWLPIWIGLAILYIPTFVYLVRHHWTNSDQAHGPVLLALALWMMWRQWPAPSARDRRNPVLGWSMIVVGLVAYVIGRSQSILIFEIGSVPWMLAGLISMQRGFHVVRQTWFAYFLLCFLIPMPGSVVSLVTMPMRLLVSTLTEHILYAAGYPISRTGVMLQIGYYQLLVADACSGIQTVLTLEAMGLLYMNVVRHSSALRNIVLGLCIVPISITANVIRVIALTLITYHLGDDAGQGFLHGFAGLVLFLSAFALVIGLDSALRLVVRKRAATVGSPQ